MGVLCQKSLLVNTSNLFSHLKNKHYIVYNAGIDEMEAYTYLVGIYCSNTEIFIPKIPWYNIDQYRPTIQCSKRKQSDLVQV